MRVVITIFLISALWSCSANWHLRQAIKKGANQKVDTVRQTVKIPVPEVSIDTVIRSIAGDTVFIEKDRLKIKYVKLPGDSVFIEGKCEADTIYQEVKVPVVTKISAPKGFWFWFPWILVVIVLIIIAGVFSRVRK